MWNDCPICGNELIPEKDFFDSFDLPGYRKPIDIDNNYLCCRTLIKEGPIYKFFNCLNPHFYDSCYRRIIFIDVYRIDIHKGGLEIYKYDNETYNVLLEEPSKFELKSYKEKDILNFIKKIMVFK